MLKNGHIWNEISVRGFRMQIDCFRAKTVFVIAIIGAITTIGTLILLINK